MLDVLAGGGTDSAVLHAAPAGCELGRPHIVVHAERTGAADWNAVASRLDVARIERVTGLALDAEDLLALELAVKLVRLDGARRRAAA